MYETGEQIVSASGLSFLRLCYSFVNRRWPHMPHQEVPDQGFEGAFRTACVTCDPTWTVAQQRELGLGGCLVTASGMSHETDIVVRCGDTLAVAEMKNRRTWHPDKNDVIVFYAKILDFLTANPTLLYNEVLPTFLSTTDYDRGGIAACLGLGIHPIGPFLRPLPILVDSMLRIGHTLDHRADADRKIHDEYEDFRAALSQLVSEVEPTWVSSRCGCQGSDRLVITSCSYEPQGDPVELIHRLNARCTHLIEQLRSSSEQETN